MTPSFNDYVNELYPNLLSSLEKRADVPLLRTFERVALRLAYLIECGDKLPDTTAGRAARLLAAKGISEALAFVACVRKGTSSGAYHHVRAMIELLLSSHHLVCNSAKQQNRFKKFEEYPYLRALMPHLIVEEKQAQNLKPTKSEVERAKLLTQVRLKELKAHKPVFHQLWGKERKDLIKVKHWHHGASIFDLLDEQRSVPVKLHDKIREHQWEQKYEHMCHATHVSPSAHLLLGTFDVSLLGVQQDPVIFQADIVTIGEAFIGSLARVSLLVPEARLLGRSLSEIDGFYGALTGPKPNRRRRR